MDLHFQPRRDVLELAGHVVADAFLGGPAAGAGLLLLGEVMLDADVREMIEAGPPAGAGGLAPRRRHVVGRRGREGLGLGGEVGELEEMPLVRVVGPALAARAEEVAAEQGQGLGQLGVLLLEALVVGGGLIEDALELIDAAAGVVGPLALGLGPPPLILGLLPKLVVAAEQVVEEPPAFGRIIGESRRHAHDMNYTRQFMSCKSIPDDFPTSLSGPDRRAGIAGVAVHSPGRCRRGSGPVAPASARCRPVGRRRAIGRSRPRAA
jgi:hypothetical protein